MDNSFLKNFIGSFFIFLCGIFLGWFLFHAPSKPVEQEEAVATDVSNMWTCSLHNDVRQAEAGKCPICNLSLIPLSQYEQQSEQGIVRFSNNSEDLDQLKTAIVSKQSPTREINIYGKVQTDEMVVQKQRATISGRLDKLMVNTTGERVTKGQTIALLYSPEFVSAQQELLEATPNKNTNPGSYQAARARLLKFGISDAQVTAI
jgi:Cu(I)/Ag(I) efflux system membrane fusion protein